LRKAHRTLYTIHAGEKNMYVDLKKTYWWEMMKVDVAKYASSCGVCQRVKAEHTRPAGLLQSLEVLEWPQNDIAMDFLAYLVHREVRMKFGWS
jgi:hypothetical protein